ncbi:MAG: disulfide bond formation protein DsbA [Chitinophagaceae bacterium]|nr:disulfide bond formation protein DsbA [Chitinophagaceae bacterium]
MPLRPPVSSKDHIQGNSQAPLELVEYGDYQCPHCGRAYPIVKHLQQELGDKLKFVFRNFPLAQIHPEAVRAAVAAEAASLQGKYWEMHDMIFENQEYLSKNAFIAFAGKLGLDIEQFSKDIARPELLEKIDTDFESGLRSGVNATPTFFINDEKYTSGWEGERILAFIKTHYPDL